MFLYMLNIWCEMTVGTSVGCYSILSDITFMRKVLVEDSRFSEAVQRYLQAPSNGIDG